MDARWRSLKTLRRLAAYAWAAPYTGLGMALGLLVVLFGGRARLEEGTVEFGGGGLGSMLSRLPRRFGFCAITLGHSILGLDDATLASVRAHERVHVRQYERWGPLFVPAYLLCSLALLARGRRPYRDNPFEREAYATAQDRAAGSG
jgi:hypothetical protein